jgi:DNA-binding SARP family transcriptional activator
MGNMGKLRIKLFGPTTVLLADGTAVTDLGGIKPRQVLEMLALSAGTPVTKDRLVDQLWDGKPPRTYIGTLESYVSLLRRRMGVGRGRGSALATTSNGYVLDPTQVEVDVDEFRRLVQPGLGASPEETLARTRSALELVGGDLLASEPYADWAAHERTIFQGEYVQACTRAASHALTVGDPDLGAQLARRAIGYDASSELPWQLLMRALSASGARGDALRAYLDLRRTLVEELGTEPSPATQKLYLELLAEGSTPARSESGQGVARATVNEVRTLLNLLADALEGFPEGALSHRDRRLTERAERLVSAA